MSGDKRVKEMISDRNELCSLLSAQSAVPDIDLACTESMDGTCKSTLH